jgi:hypothetical protein
VKAQLQRLYFFRALLLASLALSACSAAGGSSFEPDGEESYRPVAAGEVTPLAGALQGAGLPATPAPATPTAAQPSPTPACISGLRYIEDLSLPDGSQVAPGSKLDKRWRVENDGTCNWDSDYRIRPVAGSPMGAPPELALYPARSGVQAVIQIIFTAPAEPGAYRSAWQAYDPGGEPFGDPFFIDILVAQ